MPNEISPELFAQRFLEQQGSHEVNVKPGFFFNFPRRVLPSAGNLALTAAMSGSIMLFDATGATAYTLPAITDAEKGIYFDFVWTATAVAAHSITAQAGDLLIGTALMAVSGAADVDAYFPNGSSNLVMSSNGSTTGGLAGSRARFTAVSATRWEVSATLVCTGVQATPFA